MIFNCFRHKLDQLNLSIFVDEWFVPWTTVYNQVKRMRLPTVSEIDQYLWMVGGSAGALALTGVAAASAFYLSTRPKPEKPLVTLHEQSLLEPVSYHFELLKLIFRQQPLGDGLTF